MACQSTGGIYDYSSVVAEGILAIEKNGHELYSVYDAPCTFRVSKQTKQPQYICRFNTPLLVIGAGFLEISVAIGSVDSVGLGINEVAVAAIYGGGQPPGADKVGNVDISPAFCLAHAHPCIAEANSSLLSFPNRGAVPIRRWLSKDEKMFSFIGFGPPGQLFLFDLQQFVQRLTGVTIHHRMSEPISPTVGIHIKGTPQSEKSLSRCGAPGTSVFPSSVRKGRQCLRVPTHSLCSKGPGHIAHLEALCQADRRAGIMKRPHSHGDYPYAKRQHRGDVNDHSASREGAM